jgi:hypothetical protein
MPLHNEEAVAVAAVACAVAAVWPAACAAVA